jgi:hypothetical protein
VGLGKYKENKNHNNQNLPVFLVVAILVSGCASDASLRKTISEMQKGPNSPPTKTITNFSSGLSCMDELLKDYHMPETGFLVENLNDNTGQISTGTRDMLITALASMTKRSKTIRLVAYGADSSNAISFLARARDNRLYQQLPAYDIRGSISQYDSRLASNRNNAGISFEDWGVGGSRRISGDILGVDLSVVRTADLTVIPAAISSNQVIIIDHSNSMDGDGIIKKSGLFFSFSLDRAEGTAQALRNLIELSAIELVGRLFKVPYWQCLGVPVENEAVKKEVTEWIQMFENEKALIRYVRRLLYIKGYYDINNGNNTTAFQQAVRAYQQSIGLPQNGVVDLELLLALYSKKPITEPHKTDVDIDLTAKVTEKPVPALNRPSNLKTLHNPDIIGIHLQANEHHDSHSLEVSLTKDGYLYCYFENAQQEIQRFFPNRFQPNNFLSKDELMYLPGEMPFAIEIDPTSNESITCFATEESVSQKLPLNIRGADFEVLRIQSMAVIKTGFIQAALKPIGEATLTLQSNSY